MVILRVRLKKARKPNQPRLRFDLQKLRNLKNVTCIFQETVGGKLALLVGLMNEDMDINIMITTNNTAETDVASEILKRERR